MKQLETVAWAERSRAAVVGQPHRIAFWPTLEGPYLGLIQLSLTSGDRCCAWEAVQKARSRALAELLGSSHLPSPAYLPLELRRREEELLARLRRLQAQSSAQRTLDEIAQLLDLGAALDALWAEMTPLVPEYVAQRRGDPAAVEVVRTCLGEV